jgi:hypothetical protein
MPDLSKKYKGVLSPEIRAELETIARKTSAGVAANNPNFSSKLTRKTCSGNQV